MEEMIQRLFFPQDNNDKQSSSCGHTENRWQCFYSAQNDNRLTVLRLYSEYTVIVQWFKENVYDRSYSSRCVVVQLSYE